MPTRTALITGARGFVGRHLVAALTSAHGQQSCADLPVCIVAAAHDGSGTSVCDDRTVCAEYAADIRDAGAVSKLFDTVQPDDVYHLAARASGADRDRQALWDVNVRGTRNVLDGARSLGRAVRVLVISTGYVYGDTRPERPAREEDALPEPIGDYAASKVEMERVAAAYPDIAIVVRAFTHTGPGQAPGYALSSFARQLALAEVGRQTAVLRTGRLDALRDILDVRDVVHAYGMLMRHGEPGKIYNMATAQPISLSTALTLLRGLCWIGTEAELDPARLRPADIGCSTGDPSRLKAATGWEPRRSLFQTLDDLLGYWRKEVICE